MSTPDTARLMEGLREHTAALAGAVTGHDPQGHVPTCPEWRLRDLVVHLGQAHRWTTDLVLTGAAKTAPDPAAARPGSPVQWPDWLREGAVDLVAAVATVGPETEVSAINGLQPVSFWLRRMTHETAVHYADGALAVGAPYVIAPDLAADAISEGLELMTAPRAVQLKPELAELRGHGETLAVCPERDVVGNTAGDTAAGLAGPEHGWLIERTPEGPRLRPMAAEDAAKATVSVSAPVRELLLVLTRRLSLADAGAKVTGERAVLDHWLEHTAF